MSRFSFSALSMALVVGVSTMFLAGCTVGPDYVAPKVVTPESFASSEAPAVVEVLRGENLAPAPDAAWWHALGDELLAELVQDAAAHNHDLVQARARLREARALRRMAASRQRPQVGAGASAQAFRGSENAPGAVAALAQQGLADLDGEAYQGGFQASWELDLFGGIRRSVEAADAQLAASEEAEHAVHLGVIAEVARVYSALRGAQRRLALAEKNVKLQADTYEVVSVKARVGLVSELDEKRAVAQLEGTRSRVPPLRAAVRAAGHRLAVLTGRPPDALLERLLTSRPLTNPPDLVPVGLPSDLLRRRPDVRLAERRLAGATAEVGVRTAALYPRFSLSGGAGFEGGSFTDLFESSSRTWSLLGNLMAPIFQGGRLRAGVSAAQARREEHLAAYEQTVLQALEDVETSLVGYAEEELRRRTLAEAARASARASQLARVLYDKGLEDYLTVLDAERNLTEVEDQLAASETGVVLQMVGLYAALGGGWEVGEEGAVMESLE